MHRQCRRRRALAQGRPPAGYAATPQRTGQRRGTRTPGRHRRASGSRHRARRCRDYRGRQRQRRGNARRDMEGAAGPRKPQAHHPRLPLRQRNRRGALPRRGFARCRADPRPFPRRRDAVRPGGGTRGHPFRRSFRPARQGQRQRPCHPHRPGARHPYRLHLRRRCRRQGRLRRRAHDQARGADGHRPVLRAPGRCRQRRCGFPRHGWRETPRSWFAKLFGGKQ